MNVLCRRGFLKGTALSALGCAINLSFLRELSRTAAADTGVDPNQVRFGPDLDPLVALIQSTARDKCVPAFIAELRTGLSYQRFLASLFLAALRTGDPHQVAQVYAAHRVGSEARLEERRKSDDACRRAFGILTEATSQQAFLQTARGFLCAKASPDPHDLKYPAAAFEDAYSASPEWRPYLLASSVHALHGSKSDDAGVLVQAREALR